MYGGSTSALPEDGHQVRVTSEGPNIVLDPLECHHLVLHTVVAGQDMIAGAQVACKHQFN